MNESELLRVCIIGSVLGIIALYILTSQPVYNNVKIGEVDNSCIGNIVNITGNVVNLYEHRDGHLFFDLDDGTGSIKVVLWDDVLRRLELDGVNISHIENGVKLQVLGTVEIYKGEFEVLPIRSDVKFV